MAGTCSDMTKTFVPGLKSHPGVLQALIWDLDAEELDCADFGSLVHPEVLIVTSLSHEIWVTGSGTTYRVAEMMVKTEEEAVPADLTLL